MCCEAARLPNHKIHVPHAHKHRAHIRRSLSKWLLSSARKQRAGSVGGGKLRLAGSGSGGCSLHPLRVSATQVADLCFTRAGQSYPAVSIAHSSQLDGVRPDATSSGAHEPVRPLRRGAGSALHPAALPAEGPGLRIGTPQSVHRPPERSPTATNQSWLWGPCFATTIKPRYKHTR